VARASADSPSARRIALRARSAEQAAGTSRNPPAEVRRGGERDGSLWWPFRSLGSGPNRTNRTRGRKATAGLSRRPGGPSARRSQLTPPSLLLSTPLEVAAYTRFGCSGSNCSSEIAVSRGISPRIGRHEAPPSRSEERRVGKE